MRGNHCVGRRYGNHHRLAKRVSAFGLALAVVCGCLTPVFASQPEPAAAKDTAGAAAMDGGIALPVADGSVAVEDGGTVTQPTVTTRTDADGNFITEYDWGDSQTVWKDEEAVVSQPEQGMDEPDPAFGESTVTYRFWLGRPDAYTLEQLALDAEAAGLTETEYLVQLGSGKQLPLYHIDTIADTAYIGEHPFDQPTARDDPEGLGRIFAGWYTVDDLGIELEFDPEDASYKASSDVVDVYAKWTDPEQPKEDPWDETMDDPEGDDETAQKTVDLMASAPILNKTATASVTVQGLPGTAKTLNVFELDDTAMEAFGEAYQKTLNGAGSLTPLFGLEIAPQDANGVPVQPDGPVTVTITGLNELELSAVGGLNVLHQTADGVETLDARCGSGILSFETTGFSPFVLAAGAEERIDTAQITQTGKLVAGETVTLTSDRYAGGWYNTTAHTWTSSDESVAEVRWYSNGETDTYYMATVRAIKPGTATIKHFYNGQLQDTFEIEVTKGPEGNGAWVYLYAKVYGDTSGLTLNAHDYFTIGKAWVPSMDDETTALQKINHGSHYDESSTGAGRSYYDTVLNYIKSRPDQVIRYEQNSKVLLDSLTWTGSKNNTQFGLVIGSGADTYVPNWHHDTWHLDGYIDGSELGEVTVNYYIEGTATKLKDSENIKGSIGQRVEAKTYAELYPKLTDERDGRTYGYVYANPESCTIVHGKCGEINLYYRIASNDVTVAKIVTGGWGGGDTDFRFTITIDGAVPPDSLAVTLPDSSKAAYLGGGVFTLKDGGSITFKNLPVGARVEVAEQDPGGNYTTSWTLDGGEDEGDGRTAVIASVADTGSRLTFTNYREFSPDTGVIPDTLPYLQILAAAAGGGALRLLRKRRSKDDDA